MPRSRKQILKSWYLADFLRENTDVDHPIGMGDILEFLEKNDISAERRSVYADIDSLKSLGVDIQSVRHGNNTVYYIGKREFELSELKLLVDAVQSSKFITEDKSFSMINRLEKLGSSYQAKQLRRQVWVRGRVKSMNESIFNNVDKINLAIMSNCKILFHYFTWNQKKEQVLRRNGEQYAVSPWALLLDNENYYLLAYEDGVMKHFRVDKMLEIQLADCPREGKELFDVLDMAAYTDTHFGMFSGENTPVKLRFENSFAGIAIDQFGTDTIFVPEDENHFTVTVNVAVNVHFYGWLSSLGDKVQIISPQSAVNGMREHLKTLLTLYMPPEATAHDGQDISNAGVSYNSVTSSSLLSVYDTVLFVDTETTGFNADTDCIIEFSAIKVTRDGKDLYSTFVRLPSDVSIPESITSLTGITREMCESGITHEELREKIIGMVNGKTLLVAYNAHFDASFILKLTGPLNVDYLDSMTVYRDRSGAPHKLSDAIAHYHLDASNTHRSLDDADALMKVTLAMEAEKSDLLSYINRFGYKAKYGIHGKQIEGINYYIQLE